MSRPADSGSLRFLGGAGTVTGSKTLVDTDGGRVLVDCGVFQGLKQLRLRNWEPFPVPPASVDAVLLTHAHLDHCGYLPRLVREGFAGPIYCTEGTCRLAGIVLPDSGRLHEEEAGHANRHGYSKHTPALPLYTEADALACLPQLTAVDLDRAVSVLPGLEAAWRRAGHILGAAWIQLRVEAPSHPDGLRVVFSGDLGRSVHPLLLPPEPIGAADLVVTESTYGDELHSHQPPEDVIAEVLIWAAGRGGVVVVPAFAVDRTEVVLWHLDRLLGEGRVPRMPVVIDSPMASRALDVYEDAARDGSDELRPEFRGKGLFTRLRFTEAATAEDSKALNGRRGPMVIVSASGMATGGRVIHHLANRIGDPRNVVLLAGFQAPGTRGHALAHGAKALKMLGQEYPVRARIASVPLSSHADRGDVETWLGTAVPPPARIVVNHGEPQASDALAQHLRHRYGARVTVAEPGLRVPLSDAAAEEG